MDQNRTKLLRTLTTSLPNKKSVWKSHVRRFWTKNLKSNFYRKKKQEMIEGFVTTVYKSIISKYSSIPAKIWFFCTSIRVFIATQGMKIFWKRNNFSLRIFILNLHKFFISQWSAMHTGMKTRSFVMLSIANWHLAAITSQFEHVTVTLFLRKF